MSKHRKKSSGCDLCGRALKDPVSLVAGRGPTCRGKGGTLSRGGSQTGYNGNGHVGGLKVELSERKRYGDKMRRYYLFAKPTGFIIRVWNDEKTGERFGHCGKCAFKGKKCRHLKLIAEVDDYKFDKSGDIIRRNKQGIIL